MNFLRKIRRGIGEPGYEKQLLRRTWLSRLGTRARMAAPGQHPALPRPHVVYRGRGDIIRPRSINHLST